MVGELPKPFGTRARLYKKRNVISNDFVEQIAGLQLREVRNLDDGTLDMAELREKLRPKFPDPHEPFTSLVCIENTHNYCGGTTLPVEWIDQVWITATNHDHKSIRFYF